MKNDIKKIYGHTTDDGRPWELLSDHLKNVSKSMEKFANKFDSGDWGKVIGYWHDLGKNSNEFQKKIKNHLSIMIDHSTAGAQFAYKKNKILGKIIAYIISGHHTGLQDDIDEFGHKGLQDRLIKSIPEWKNNANQDIVNRKIPKLPEFILKHRYNSPKHASFAFSFWIRMLHSCLIDADRLETEKFMNPKKNKLRIIKYDDFKILLSKLEKQNRKFKKSPRTKINLIREDISKQTFESSQLEPGFFLLQVPTGGGKTIAGMRFAINHAIKYNKDRIFVVPPFLSIIEQNSKVYKDIFGEKNILEHHSNIEVKFDKDSYQRSLNAENFDFPIIITTMIQIFESFYSSKNSKLRKVHNFVNSIFIFDEFQTVPVNFLEPILMVLKELVDAYNCTIVFSTATQPSVEYKKEFPIGVKNIRSIIKNPKELYYNLNRVNVEKLGRISDNELIEKLNKDNSFLCIVDLKEHAKNLFLKIKDKKNLFHLSGNMCATHRGDIIREIKNNKNAKIISTQLIEAGVDIDLPIVYRNISGLDSLAQAAGRCNREGKLNKGTVYWFESEKLLPKGELRNKADVGKLISQITENKDLLSPDVMYKYFEQYYWNKKENWDKEKVLECVGKNPSDLYFQFNKMSEAFKIIKNNTFPILVPYKKGKEYIEELYKSNGDYDWKFERKIQRYVVQVYENKLNDYIKKGVIINIYGIYIIPDQINYNENFGIYISNKQTIQVI